MGVTFLCTQRKVTKRNVPPTASRCALRIGTLRSSARRGTARELAALRHLRLFALAGPAVLGSLKAWGAAIALGVACTGLAFLMFNRLIGRIGPSRASTVTYLIPLFGAAFAWLFLGEPVTLQMLIAGALILGSVAVSQKG